MVCAGVFITLALGILVAIIYGSMTNPTLTGIIIAGTIGTLILIFIFICCWVGKYGAGRNEARPPDVEAQRKEAVETRRRDAKARKLRERLERAGPVGVESIEFKVPEQAHLGKRW